MRIAVISLVLYTVTSFYGRNGDQQSPQSRIADALRDSAAVQPDTAQNPAPQPGTSLRAPIDRTTQVLDLVMHRNTE